MNALTFAQVLAKGYPEYDPGQERAADGTWSGGGQSGVSRSLASVSLDARRMQQDDLNLAMRERLKGFIVNIRGNYPRYFTIHVSDNIESGFKIAIRGTTIKADFMQVPDTPLGRAHAMRFMLALRDLAVASGIEEITTEAGLSMGGYVWPRLGFELDTTVQTTLQADVRARVQKLFNANLITQDEYSQVGSILQSWGPTSPTQLSRLDRGTMFDRAALYAMTSHASLRGRQTLGKVLLAGTHAYYRMPRAKFNTLGRFGKSASLAKGYPEYDPSQERADDGTWAAGGGVPAERSGKLDVRTMKDFELADAIKERLPGATATVRSTGQSVSVLARLRLDSFTKFTVYPDYIDAKLMEAPDTVEGHRFAVKSMLLMRDIAIASGVESIRVSAGLAMGGYVWPRLGFELDPKEYTNDLQDYVSHRLGELQALGAITDGEHDDVRILLSNWGPTIPSKIANLNKRLSLTDDQVGNLIGHYNLPLRGKQTLGKLLLAGTASYYHLPRAKFNVLGRLSKSADFVKGNPEFDPAQPRNEDGTWGGGSRSYPVAALRPSDITGVAIDTHKPSISRYRDGGAEVLNTTLREGRIGEHTIAVLWGSMVRDLDAHVKAHKVIKNVMVFRGVTGDYAEAALARLREGDAVVDRGYMSTTSRVVVAAKFARGGAVMEVIVPSGFNLAPMGPQVVGAFLDSDEKEYLLPRDTQLVFVSKRTMGGLPIYKFRVVGSLTKGEPEFNPSQPRAEDGTWSADGGSAAKPEDTPRAAFDVRGQRAVDLERKLKDLLPKGFEVAVDPYNVYSGRTRDITIHKPGTAKRDVSSSTFKISRRGVMTAELFESVNTPEGQAAAIATMNAMYHIAMDSDVQSIKLQAGLQHGGYFWPRMGFELASVEEVRSFVDNALFWLDNLTTYADVDNKVYDEIHSLLVRGGNTSDKTVATQLARRNDPLPTFDEPTSLPPLRGRHTVSKYLLSHSGADYSLPRSKFHVLAAFVRGASRRYETLTKGNPEFNPNQPRNEDGTWSSGGGGGGSSELAIPLTRGQPNLCFENARKEYWALKAAGEQPTYHVGEVSGSYNNWTPNAPKSWDKVGRTDPLTHAWVEVAGKVYDSTPFKYGYGDYKGLPQRLTKDWIKVTYTSKYTVSEDQLHESLKSFPINQRLTKGNPEFNPNQPRNEDGTWGGGSGSSDSTPTVRAARSMRDAVHTIRQRMPVAHRKLLDDKGLEYRHVASIGSRLGSRVRGRFETDGWISALLTGGRPKVLLAHNPDSMGTGESPEQVVAHETAHALDWVMGHKLSSQLGAVMREEINKLADPSAQRGKVWDYVTSPKELFAELYPVVHMGTSSYRFSITPDTMPTTMPKTYAALKALGAALGKGNPEFNPDQPRKEDGTWSGGGLVTRAVKPVSSGVRGAVRHYKGTSRKLNARLRTGADPVGDDVVLVKLLDEFTTAHEVVNKATVYRGFGSDARGVFDTLAIGDVLTDSAYQSTSIDFKVANTFATLFSEELGGVLEIEVPAGTRVGVVGQFWRHHDDERELVLPRNSRLEYLGRSEHDDKVYRFRFLPPVAKGYPEFDPQQERAEDGTWVAGSSTAPIDTSSEAEFSRTLQARFPVPKNGVTVTEYQSGYDVAIGDDDNVFTFFASKDANRPLTFEQIKTVETEAGREFARKALRTVLDAAVASNASKIRLEAAGAGGYVWPAVGFELDPDGAPNGGDAVKYFLNNKHGVGERIARYRDILGGAGGWFSNPSAERAAFDAIIDAGGLDLPAKLAALDTPITVQQMRDISGSNRYLETGVGPVAKPTLGKALLIGVSGYYALPKEKYHMLDRYINRTRKALSFSEALTKYRADQARDERGRFADEGKGRGGGVSSRGKLASRLYERNVAAEGKISTDDFIKSLPSDQRAFISRNEAKLKKLGNWSTESEFRRSNGTWAPQRQRLHEGIIREFIEGAIERGAFPDEGESPKVILMGGRGGAGKTSVVKSELGIDPEHDDNFLYLNSDDIKAKLPEYEGWNSGAVHEESSHISDQIERIARDLGMNIIYDATLKSEGSAIRRVDAYEGAGYDIEGVFVHTTPQTSTRRAIGRALRTGRYVNPSYILGSTTNEISFDAVKGRMKKWALYDNNGTKARKVASGGR